MLPVLVKVWSLNREKFEKNSFLNSKGLTLQHELVSLSTDKNAHCGSPVNSQNNQVYT